jgi:hypothetical protein
MKKNLLYAILLCFLFPEGYSQDRIITKNNDTIDCKINRVSITIIFFDLTTKGVKSSGKIPRSSVTDYSFGEKTTPEEQINTLTDSFKRFRFGINGGMGYLLGSTKEAEDLLVNIGLERDLAQSYYNDLKTGLYGSADLTFLFTPKYGAGIKYKIFETASSVEGFYMNGDGVSLFYGTYAEQIYVNYIAASFLYQEWIGSKNSFKLNSGYSLGLATYRDEAEIFTGNFLGTGKNIGFDINLGIEYFITHNFSVGTDLSVFYSSIHKMKLMDGTNTTTLDLGKENYENLSRFDFSIGARLYF